MNIWAPRESIENGLEETAVQVYFHGGAYLLGSNNFRDLSGLEIAKRQKIIVVSVAYRISSLININYKVDYSNDLVLKTGSFWIYA